MTTSPGTAAFSKHVFLSTFIPRHWERNKEWHKTQALYNNHHMTMWLNDHVTTWPYYHMSMWPHDHVAKWRHGHMTTAPYYHMSTWPHDHVTKWLHDHVTTWPHDHVTMPCSLPSAFCTGKNLHSCPSCIKKKLNRKQVKESRDNKHHATRVHFLLVLVVLLVPDVYICSGALLMSPGSRAVKMCWGSVRTRQQQLDLYLYPSLDFLNHWKNRSL